ncbi:MAG: Gfo/Idh/MocA family oxidoreductase [Aureliella sp.]
MQKHSAVVIGTGFIGPVHVEALRRAGVNVAGIVGSSPEKSRAAAGQLGLPDKYLTYQDVLSDSSVTSVHITTPNRFHYEQASAALTAGKHVLCEKPLAMDSDQSRRLVDQAAASGVAAAVAYNIRFYPLCHEASAIAASEEFGEALHVTGSYVQDWLLRPDDFNWRVLASEGGELRAVADIGTHWLDLVQFVTGQHVTRIFADLQTVHPTRHRPVGGAETFSGSNTDRETQPVAIDTEDAGCILLRFSGGGHGALHVSQTTAGRKNCLRFEIAGVNQAMAWNSEEPNSLWLGKRGDANQSVVRDPSMMSGKGAAVSNYPAGHNEGFPDTFKQLCIAFYQYIDAGDFSAAAPMPTFADGHREVRLCEAILASHREQRWVDVS